LIELDISNDDDFYVLFVPSYHIHESTRSVVMMNR